MSTNIDILFAQNLKVSCAAQALDSLKRLEIGIQAIGPKVSITQLANTHNVSRKFVYQQKEIALEGITGAFEEKSTPDDGKVIFHLPITKQWLSQFVLSLLLIGRCSYQGIVEILRDVFDYEISKGTVHNIAYSALDKCKEINSHQNLSGVRVGLHDEIYQAGDPVLVGVCADSTYCYLLSLEESCDANTWGVHLLDLKEKQNLNPDKTIADGGQSARKGQKDAWPGTPCGGDVFHALYPFSKLCTYQHNRAIDAFNTVEALQHKLNCPRGKWKKDENHQELLKKHDSAEKIYMNSKALSDDLNTLFQWIKNDILCLRGAPYKDRYELMEFIIEELRKREDTCKHRIEPVRKYLDNHKDNLLEFVLEMEERFKQVAMAFEVSLLDVQDIAELRRLPPQERWEKYAVLNSKLGWKLRYIEFAVEGILNSTVRADSLVENLNSRLRNYFTLRKNLGNDYLIILRFFINHRRFMRSEYPERVGHSPTELLTGKKHGHWLELLGFELFKQAA